MATANILLPIGAAVQPSTSFAQRDTVIGTGSPKIVYDVARFDAAADEELYWFFRALNYGSGNLTVDIEWYAENATSGVVRWGAAIAVATPETDSIDFSADALATENTVDDTHLGTTSKRPHRATATVSNLDSLAADDWVVLRLRRVGSHANDTMANDANVVHVNVSYSDA